MDELLKQIRCALPGLAQVQKSIAVFILENYKDIPFLSATTMAARIGVSDTSIIKFCMKMGFDGFGSFKKVISGHIQSEVTMYGRLENQIKEIEGSRTLEKVLAYDINNLETTLANPHNIRSFDAMVSMIENAKNIYIMGFRASALLAEYLVLHLRQQNRCVYSITPDLGDYADKLCMIKKDDLFIAVTFLRYSSEVYQSMQYLKSKDIPCALFTDSFACPCYPISDISLLCETKTFHHALSHASYFSLVNAIITETSLKRKSEMKQHMEKIEELFTAFQTFHA